MWFLKVIWFDCVKHTSEIPLQSPSPSRKEISRASRSNKIFSENEFKHFIMVPLSLCVICLWISEAKSLNRIPLYHFETIKVICFQNSHFTLNKRRSEIVQASQALMSICICFHLNRKRQILWPNTSTLNDSRRRERARWHRAKWIQLWHRQKRFRVTNVAFQPSSISVRGTKSQAIDSSEPKETNNNIFHSFFHDFRRQTQTHQWKLCAIWISFDKICAPCHFVCVSLKLDLDFLRIVMSLVLVNMLAEFNWVNAELLTKQETTDVFYF